ncbi:hypothetical protein ACIQCF_38530 [Streptomyces sp. NPDC088353]|nr:hypothetical protein [Streptomyces sp. 6-11-2]GED90655.1 hypothetical protein TNCT6_77400 [Streptomyces sp. 6-11-2]
MRPLTSVGKWYNSRPIDGDDIAGALKKQPGGNCVTALQTVAVVAYIEV